MRLRFALPACPQASVTSCGYPQALPACHSPALDHLPAPFACPHHATCAVCPPILSASLSACPFCLPVLPASLKLLCLCMVISSLMLACQPICLPCLTAPPCCLPSGPFCCPSCPLNAAAAGAGAHNNACTCLPCCLSNGSLHAQLTPASSLLPTCPC